MQKTKYDGIYKQREGVLLNMDNEALRAYKVRKERDRVTTQLEADVKELKDGMKELKEIKELLMKALANGNI
jgi:hypothetical protein